MEAVNEKKIIFVQLSKNTEKRTKSDVFQYQLYI